MVAREMKLFGAGLFGLALFVESALAGGGETTATETLNPPRFEVAFQSAYLPGRCARSLFQVQDRRESYRLADTLVHGITCS